jgi:hypothetical protein
MGSVHACIFKDKQKLCPLQQMAVPKARMRNLLFWDISKEFTIPQSVLTAIGSTEGTNQKNAALGNFRFTQPICPIARRDLHQMS